MRRILRKIAENDTGSPRRHLHPRGPLGGGGPHRQPRGVTRPNIREYSARGSSAKIVGRRTMTESHHSLMPGFRHRPEGNGPTHPPPQMRWNRNRARDRSLGPQPGAPRRAGRQAAGAEGAPGRRKDTWRKIDVITIEPAPRSIFTARRWTRPARGHALLRQVYVGGSPTKRGLNGTARLGLKIRPDHPRRRRGNMGRLPARGTGRRGRRHPGRRQPIPKGPHCAGDPRPSATTRAFRSSSTREDCAEHGALRGEEHRPCADRRHPLRRRHGHASQPSPHRGRRAEGHCALPARAGRKTAPRHRLPTQPLGARPGHGAGEERFIESAAVTAKAAEPPPPFSSTLDRRHRGGIPHRRRFDPTRLAALRAVRAVSVGPRSSVSGGAAGAVAFTGAIPLEPRRRRNRPGLPPSRSSTFWARATASCRGLLKGWLDGEDWPTALTYANCLRRLRRQPPRGGGGGGGTATPAYPSCGRAAVLSSRRGVVTLPPRAMTRSWSSCTGPRNRHVNWPRAQGLRLSDHRAQLEELPGADPARIGRFKELCLDCRSGGGRRGAARLTVSCATAASVAARTGVHGRGGCRGSGSAGRWSFRAPAPWRFEPEIGADLGGGSRNGPREHVVKCLCFCHLSSR